MEFFNAFNRKKGILVHSPDRCSYCGICEKKCPHKAVKVNPGNKTWKLRLICMKCGRCIRECPSDALQLLKKETEN